MSRSCSSRDGVRPRAGMAAGRGSAIPTIRTTTFKGSTAICKSDVGPDLSDPQVRERQAAYLRKVVDTVNDLDNVLYEVTNEGGTKDWDWWVVRTVQEYEKTKAKQHPVGLTGHGSESNDEMLASPAAWISPGSDGWQDLKTDPRPAAGHESQPARHGPRVRRRRRPEMGLEGFFARVQRALHGPLRRSSMGADPHESR